MKVIKIILAIAFSLIIMISKVKADEEYTIRKVRYQNIYAVYDGPDRVHLFYGQWYSLGGTLAYCIEPGVGINTTTYYGTENLSLSGIDAETLKKVKLIAYYGYKYNYGIHQTDNYYLATQELIWRAITGREIYWVSEESINGPRINVENEKNVINELVSKHYQIPSFTNQTYEVESGDTIVLKDNNNILNNFELYQTDTENIRINNNQMTITPTKSMKISLVRKSYTDEITLVYYNGDNQKLMSSTGALEPVIASFEIKVKNHPRIKVHKVDADTKKRVYIRDIKFKIKNIDTNEYICDNDECLYQTNEFGEFITNPLAYGNYQIEEVDEPIAGYTWNSKHLKFTIDENSPLKEIDGETYLTYDFENTKVTGSLKVVKVGEKPIYEENLIAYDEMKLSNVVFNLYAKDDILASDKTIIYEKDAFIGTYKTQNGEVLIDNLPLGSYYLKEISTDKNHILNKEPYEFAITYLDQYTNKVEKEITIKNYLKKGTLEFVKTAFNSGIPLPDTLIEIYTIDDLLIYTDHTNDLGKIVLEGLSAGKYYIIEKTAPIGYQINPEKVYFEIKENNQFVKTNMIDELYKVPSTNKNKNYFVYVISLILFITGGYLFIHAKK